MAFFFLVKAKLNQMTIFCPSPFEMPQKAAADVHERGTLLLEAQMKSHKLQ